MQKKPILAFDCSATGASIALRTENGTQTVQLAHNRQSAELVSAMDGLMRAQGLGYAALSCLVTTVGPGSFTGIRVGLATAHGLALAAGIPIKTLTSLEALAWAVSQQAGAPERFLTHLRAGKGEVYVQPFTATPTGPVAAGEITLLPESTTDWPLPCYGNLAPADSEYFLAASDAAVLCTIAHHLPLANLADAMPLYIRPPDAKIPSVPAWLA